MITNLLEPKALLLLLPLILAFGFFIFKTMLAEDPLDRKERKRFRRIMFITRTLILILLVIALAKPFGEVTTTTPGNPQITILVDNSTSMEIMDTAFFSGLEAELSKEFPVNVKVIGRGTDSALGDEILGYLEKDTNLLLITDGNSNTGAALEEVSLVAASLNSTISAISLKPRRDEVGVYITGVDSSVKGVNNSYAVKIVNPKETEATLRVIVDDTEVFNGPAKSDTYNFQWSFEEGDHKIIAEVSTPNDHFLNNNRFYKTVSTVKKPKVLLVQNTPDPVEQIFGDLYEVTKTSQIPDNVNDYYAVIINDMPANIPGIEKLADYLIDRQGGYYGNGLVVIGGFDSFDRGGYKGSILESYLPVTVGKPAAKRGSSNIAISIDFSGTTGARFYCPNPPEIGCKKGEWAEDKSNVQDVNKALAVSIIKSLGPDNSVGASIFSTQSATVSEIAPLFQVKDDLIDKISRVQQPGGQSYFHIGLSGAYAVLKDHVGSNNIIMITDGQTGNPEIRKATIDTAKTLNSRGVKVYIVGTGRNVDEEFLKDVAYNGGGVYFPATQSNNLKILFGEPSDGKFGEVFDLFVLNPYHFITQGLTLDANLYGFNQVIPKSNALLLVTTQHGDPALTAWNYGLGRVTALNVFSGNNNLGDLMNKRNSILLTRMVNWAIGDPQRKEPYYVVIEDARLGIESEVTIKSEKYPNVEGFSLTKVGENQYQTTITADSVGFHQVLGKSYAVNYEEEYEALGMNPNMEAVVGITSGKLFEPGDRDEISEFVKTVSKRTKTEKTTIVWPFLVAAAILFLMEILIRRIREYRLNK